MTELEHSLLTVNHVPHRFEFANAAAREAAVGFTVNDLKTLSLDLDTYKYYTLLSISPIIWKKLVPPTEKLGNLFISGEGSISDTSGNTKPITVYGDPHIVPGSGIHFDGDNDYLSISNNGDFTFGDGDFTIDFWAKFADMGWAAQVPICIGMAVGDSGVVCPFRLYVGAGVLQLYMSSTGASYDIINGTKNWTPSTNVLVHIALVRSGNTIFMFQNGILINSFTTSLPLYYNVDYSLLIGTKRFQSDCYQGYLSKVRVVKGEALWTLNFALTNEALFYQ